LFVVHHRQSLLLSYQGRHRVVFFSCRGPRSDPVFEGDRCKGNQSIAMIQPRGGCTSTSALSMSRQTRSQGIAPAVVSTSQARLGEREKLRHCWPGAGCGKTTALNSVITGVAGTKATADSIGMGYGQRSRDGSAACKPNERIPVQPQKKKRSALVFPDNQFICLPAMTGGRRKRKGFP